MKQNATVAYLKAFAIYLVIIGHALSYYTDTFQRLSAWGATTVKLIYLVHVPLFFAIAGYLNHRQPLGTYYQKKVLRLLVPFITFSFLKLLYTNAISAEFSHAEGFTAQLIDAFVYGRLYWFIYCMWFIYLIAPLLWLSPLIPAIVLPLLLALNEVNEIRGLWRTDNTTPFQLGRISIYGVFFIMGYVCRQQKEHHPEYKQLHPAWFAGIGTVIPLSIALLARYDLLPNVYLVQTAVSFLLMIPLISFARLLPAGISLFDLSARYSLQLMFLDSFFKVVLFTLARRLIPVNAITALLLAVIDCMAGLATCCILEKMPRPVRLAIGL